MSRLWLTLFIPPLAACKYGCKSCCAAPIGVFWLAGIVALIYGLVYGGPVTGAGTQTALVGVALWVIASIWANFVVKGADSDRCRERDSNWCSTILPDENEVDPMDEIRKAR